MSGAVTAIDTNILLYSLNSDAPEYQAARAFLDRRKFDPSTVLSELVLVELYVLLRNPIVVPQSLSAPAAGAVIERFRRHPRWQLLDHDRNVMSDLWALASAPGFGRNRIFDARLALGLLRAGVTCIATRNTKHFDGMGLDLLNPID